jgi:hypothetical protein
MHACCLLLYMSLKYFLLCILNNEKGIGKRKKSKGGLEGSVPQPVSGWVFYSGHVDVGHTHLMELTDLNYVTRL